MYWKVAPQILIDDVFKITFLSYESWLSGSFLSCKDLEQEYPKSINITLYCESANNGVLRGQVTHGSTGFEGREDDVICQEIVKAGAGEKRGEMVVNQDIVSRYALVDQRRLIFPVAV